MFDEASGIDFSRNEGGLPHGGIGSHSLDGEESDGILSGFRSEGIEAGANHAFGFYAAEEAPGFKGDADCPTPSISFDLRFSGECCGDHEVIEFALLRLREEVFCHAAGIEIEVSGSEELVNGGGVDPGDVLGFPEIPTIKS